MFNNYKWPLNNQYRNMKMTFNRHPVMRCQWPWPIRTSFRTFSLVHRRQLYVLIWRWSWAREAPLDYSCTFNFFFTQYKCPKTPIDFINWNFGHGVDYFATLNWKKSYSPVLLVEDRIVLTLQPCEVFQNFQNNYFIILFYSLNYKNEINEIESEIDITS